MNTRDHKNLRTMKKYQQWKSVLFVFLLLSSAMAIATPGDDDCPVPEGIQVSEVSATSARITWSPADGGSSYEVNVENADGNPVYYNYEQTIKGLSVNIDGLNGGSGYKVKVRTNCGDDHSDWSDRVVFSTSGSGSGGTGGTGGTGSGSCAVPGGLTISSLTSTSVTLEWNSVSGASGYEVEIEDGDNTPAFERNYTVSSTSKSVTGLTAGGEYKFKVKSKCSSSSSDYSGWYFFVTPGNNGGNGGDDGNNGGGSCDIPTGLMVSNVTSTSATLSWNAASGAVSYEVEVEDGDNTPFFNQEVVVTGTSYEVTGLSAGGEYKFKVKSECGSGSSDHAAWVFFNTSGSGDGGNDGGSTGDCAIPEGLSVSNFTGTGVTLSWSAAPGAVGYEVELEDGENTPLLEIKRNTTASSIIVEGLMEGGQYKFKVKSICTAGSTDYSPWFFFLATETGIQDANNGGNDGLVCTTPTGLLATNLASGDVLLSWEDQPGAISYELEIESEETTPFFVRNIMTAESSYEITGLVEGGLYKFKVKSQCTSGSSDHAPEVFFTVGSDAGNGGNNADCSIPQQLSVEEVTTNSALLSWQPVEGAIAYELEIEDDEATPFFSINTEVIGTSYMVTGLTEGGNYHFKVKSICSTGSSDHAPDHFFSTLTNEISGQIVGVTVFPNPASDFVRIDLTQGGRSGQVQLQLVSVTGRIVWNRRIDTNDTQTLEVVLGQFAPGLYQVNVISEDGMIGKKLMINP